MQKRKPTQTSLTTIAVKRLAITSKRMSGKFSLCLLLCLFATACTVASTPQRQTPDELAVTSGADEAVADSTVTDSTVTDSTEPDQNGETPATTAEGKSSDTQKSNESALQSVPPNGLESLTEEGLSYFQQMGPLEYAARLGGIPQQQAWRVRLQLDPNNTGDPDGQTYLVKLKHYNLSPALYRDLLPSYGENVDPSLAEESPHQNFQFTFFPVMGIAADLLSEATVISQSPMTENPACGIDLACADLRIAPERDPSSAESISLESAPWESEVAPIYSLVRALAAQAGWREAGTSSNWRYGEVPEGLSHNSAWVEILIDNYIGNGDGYSAEWIEHVADDSIRKVVHQIVYSDRTNAGQATTKYICARGEAAGELRNRCP